MNRYPPRFTSVWPRPFYQTPGYQLSEAYSPNGQSAAPTPPREPRLRQPVEAVFGVKPAQAEPPAPAPAEPAANEIDWKARALALQAEMAGFRQRQARRAEEAGSAEKERLLTRLLPVADNLSRALAHADQTADTLQQGVALTQRELLRLLEAEGLNRIETVGRPFDPTRHEAVAVTATEAEPGTILQEIEAGYMLGEKLLRPARVVVAG